MEDKNSKASKKHYLFYSCKKRKFFHSSETTSGNNSKNNNDKKRKTSKETRDQIDLGSTTYVSSKQNKIKGCQKKKNNSKVPINIAPVLPNYNKSSLEKDADREKKRIARKKERRATLILGLIMGSFIACWFPFFFLYSISPVCPICEDSPTSPCCVMGWGFSFAFWLGYSNSALNPVIYTIFNKDFRQAFKRILFR
jgi:HD-GYP domain-containing protein (c-di-GMP phosphodiesterase class II)